MLTLKDRLSRLTFLQAVKLLCERGETLIYEGGRYDILIDEQVHFSDEPTR